MNPTLKMVSLLDKANSKVYKRRDSTLQKKIQVTDLLAKYKESLEYSSSVFSKEQIETKQELREISIMKDRLGEVYQLISDIKEELETQHFYSKSKGFNIEYLRKSFYDKKLDELFPKFDLEKFLGYLLNPILEIINPDGEKITYDPFVIKKFMISLCQMIWNEMDVYYACIGPEGNGKSCLGSQFDLWFATVLKNVGLIDYEFKAEERVFSDLESAVAKIRMIELPFEILDVDEGNDLNRASQFDELVKEFKFDMRTGRKDRKIVGIKIQQVGELDTSLTLSRMNYVFDCRVRTDPTTKLLIKGDVDMYIIPKGEKIYSEYHKKEIYKEELINGIAEKLDRKKDYYKGLPKQFIIHKFKFDGIWGFNKAKYDEHIKTQNKKRKFGKNFKLTSAEAYSMFAKIVKPGLMSEFDMKNIKDRRLYQVFSNMMGKIRKQFELNPELLEGMRRAYKD